MLLSFVIPVFNEEESLDILYREILENLSGNSYEILFIDDGSTDRSYDVIEAISRKDKNVKIIKFRKNFGKAAGLNSGFKYASGDIVFTMDADLQDNPAEIPSFLHKINEGFDLVTGWKKKRNDPLNKTLPSKLFNSVTSEMFNLKLHDYNCGFKAYRKELIIEIDIYGEMHRYIPALANAKGFKVAEIPVRHRERSFGKSKYGFERYLRGFLDLLTVKLVTQYIRSPLYLFGGIGAIFSGTGFLAGLYLTVLKYFFHYPLSNRPLLFLAMLLIIAGIQFFSIGLIGELIVNQNRKLNKDSIVSIEKKINFTRD
ncbi:MAG: glycosyltransferase [Candidatus Cloacimonadota bacterium]|nr:MAG: glycosyltransferase [Candidatus Cloacimonadota bacterium]